mmetsp:Transcript_34285/g.47527  ORF Transcript_34285/g.47527 Transcript_34285/m.47527 type:complete len:168 (+) Transcript_34285:133-636(+)
MTRNKMRPTGIAIFQAQALGFPSVAHWLQAQLNSRISLFSPNSTSISPETSLSTSAAQQAGDFKSVQSMAPSFISLENAATTVKQSKISDATISTLPGYPQILLPTSSDKCLPRKRGRPSKKAQVLNEFNGLKKSRYSMASKGRKEIKAQLSTRSSTRKSVPSTRFC